MSMLVEMLMLVMMPRRCWFVDGLSLPIDCVAFEDIILVRFHGFDTIIYNPKTKIVALRKITIFRDNFKNLLFGSNFLAIHKSS